MMTWITIQWRCEFDVVFTHFVHSYKNPGPEIALAQLWKPNLECPAHLARPLTTCKTNRIGCLYMFACRPKPALLCRGLARAAGALAVGRGAMIVKLQGDADHVVAFGLQQRSGRRRIDTAGHGDDDPGEASGFSLKL